MNNLIAVLRHAAGRLPVAQPRPRLIFIHIPKCAGSSVERAIAKAYYPRLWRAVSRLLGRSQYAHASIRPEASLACAQALGLNLSEARAVLLSYEMALAQNGYISGHVPFSRKAAEALGLHWNFITILREPVDRFFSEFYYLRFGRSDHFQVREELEDYLETEDARRVSSQITNFLTGRTDGYVEPTSADVDNALENLRFFAVVGFSEEINRFADAMAQSFGRRPDIRRTNTSPAPDNERTSRFDPAIRKRVEKLCAADIEIYKQARELFGT